MSGSNYWGLTYTYVRTVLSIRAGGLRAAWRDGDRGASAVELAVITAIILGIAVVLLGVIAKFVTTESNSITPPGGGAGGG